METCWASWMVFLLGLAEGFFEGDLLGFLDGFLLGLAEGIFDGDMLGFLDGVLLGLA